MFWLKKDERIKRLEEKLRMAEQERDWAQQEAGDLNEILLELQVNGSTAERLRNRTHVISERMSRENGKLTRDLERTDRALFKAMALLGANMDGRLRSPVPWFEVRDYIRDIHGLVPDVAPWTDIGYRLSLAYPVEDSSTSPVPVCEDVGVDAECDCGRAVA